MSDGIAAARRLLVLVRLLQPPLGRSNPTSEIFYCTVPSYLDKEERTEADRYELSWQTECNVRRSHSWSADKHLT